MITPDVKAFNIKDLNKEIDQLIEQREDLDKKISELHRRLHEEKMKTDDIYQGMYRISLVLQKDMYGYNDD